MADALFEGNDFEAWISHFQIGSVLKKILVDFGVNEVTDLAEVYPYMDLLQDIQSKVTNKDLKKFFRAFKFTKVLSGTVLPPAISAMLFPKSEVSNVQDLSKSSAANTRSRSTVGNAILQSRKEATARHKEEEDDRKRLLDMEVEGKRRKLLIDALEDKLQSAASLDVAIVLDCTGSMRTFLNAAKQNITMFVTSLRSVYPDIPLRVAFVGYRDHGDPDSKRLAVLRFTTNIKVFHDILRIQDAEGGGHDGCAEDVHGALRVAETLDWQASNRVLYHIADNPAHGREFNDCCDYRGDAYPKGDPHGLQAIDILTSLRDQNVQYFFGKIQNTTDKMIARFNTLMKSEYVVTTPMNARNMISVLTASITSSLVTSLSTTSCVDGKVPMKEVKLVGGVPNFSRIQSEKAHRFELKESVDIRELVAATVDNCLDQSGKVVEVRVKVATNPFAKGGMKAAYYGYECETEQPVVLKESMSVSASRRTFARYEAFLACHHAAISLAVQFNAAKPAACATIRFCDAAVLQLTERPDQPYFVEEEQLAGRFEKFNNNAGLNVPSPTPAGTRHEAVQAFSHWTHSVTGGARMVVDCKGVYAAETNTFTLTDPAIHAKVVTRFGGTNQGTVGFQRFYKTHECNEICRAIGLTVPNDIVAALAEKKAGK
jgi:hypothetical protein